MTQAEVVGPELMYPRDAFFDMWQGWGLTYADITEVTRASDVDKANVNTRTKFTSHTELGLPFVAAAMGDVSDRNMVTVLDKLGCTAVLPASLSVEQLAYDVRRIKHELSGYVNKPKTASATETLGDVLKRCDREDWSFRSFPVVDDDDIFAGVLTKRDFGFALGNMDMLVSDAMTPAQQVITGEPGMDVRAAYKRMQEGGKRKILPIIEDGRVPGMYVFSDVERTLTGNPDNYSLDGRGRLLVAVALPTHPDRALEKIEAMTSKTDGSLYLDVAVLDSARGDSNYARDTLRAIKRTYDTRLDVMPGNITDPESAVILKDEGADGLKIGQGPGRICSTRDQTGTGTPQVTAVYECEKALRGEDEVPLCADGGIVKLGDVSKAIAVGARTVMMGGMFAGTDEAPPEVVWRNGRASKPYNGEASPSNLRAKQSSRDRYDVEEDDEDPLPEGVDTLVELKGPVADVVKRLSKALRKSMELVGSPDIETHRTNVRFKRMSQEGVTESSPHNVNIVSP